MSAASVLLACAACDNGQQVLGPAGPAARRLAHLSVGVFVTFLAVTVVMWCLVAVVATKRGGTFDDHAPHDAGGGLGWIIVGGIGLPAFVLAILFVSSLGFFGSPARASGGAPPDIVVTGRRWWWRVEHVGAPGRPLTANEIHVVVGRPTRIVLRSADVIHSFWVPELAGKVDLVPGRDSTIVIDASAPGVYRGQCSEFCGAQHAHMRLLVVAESEDDHERWLADQAQDAAPPRTAEQARGRELVLSRGCAGCHRIQGTPAAGSVGPDLSHVASRRLIAATLPNDTARLTAWIVHAQSLKPETLMPDESRFRGDELRDTVAYLQSLR